ncbi:MAG TPA: hypothetical protein VMA75_03950 [Candidatus Paceibacterota bacterium]|nr:hypothetical protein [Candidatus Paceibacterota bacterium]
MELLQRDDPRRQWRSFRRNAAFVCKTLFLAAAITGIWYFMWLRGWHFPKDELEIQIGQNTTGQFTIYGIFIAWIIYGSKQKYDATITAVMMRDKKTYLRFRDERQPIMLHLMVGMLSVPSLVMVMLTVYRHAITGIVSVFSFAMAIVGFWFIIALLENPTKSAWVDERTPASWKTANVDKFFGLGKNTPLPSPDSKFWDQ